MIRVTAGNNSSGTNIMQDFIGRERGEHHWLGKMNAPSSNASTAGTEVAGLEGYRKLFS
jgi:hypothetical protein